jgi:hypothetical protein
MTNQTSTQHLTHLSSASAAKVAQLEDRATSQDDHQDVAKLKGNGC